MFSKIAAAISALVACFLGFGAVSIFRSGDRGYLVLLGLILALGSVVLFILAASLYTRGSLPARRRSTPTTFSRGQRFGLIAAAALSFTLGGYALATGKTNPNKSSSPSREKHPSQYWQMVLLYFGTGFTLLYLGVRSSPPQDRDPQNKSRGRRDRGDA
jgi:hypothetical protein